MSKYRASKGFMPRPIPLLCVDGPLMVFGGPYSNLEATRAVLDEGTRLSISADRIICTGDVVAYGADAAATVDLVRDRVGHVVMGNCEESLAAGSDDCGCGFPTGSSCERLSAAWFAHASRQLNTDARAWMANLPRRINLEIGGCRLAVIHGGVDVINRFIFSSTATATIAMWGLSGFFSVDPDELGVVLRFGKYVRDAKPGLNYHLPYPIELVLTPKVTWVNRIDIGMRLVEDLRRGTTMRDVSEESSMLTGDENIVDVNFSKAEWLNLTVWAIICSTSSSPKERSRLLQKAPCAKLSAAPLFSQS